MAQIRSGESVKTTRKEVRIRCGFGVERTGGIDVARQSLYIAESIARRQQPVQPVRGTAIRDGV